MCRLGPEMEERKRNAPPPPPPTIPALAAFSFSEFFGYLLLFLPLELFGDSAGAKTEHKRAMRKGDVNNHIAEHNRLTNHTIDWDSAECLTYSTNYFQRLILESWFTNLKQTPLTGVNHYRYQINDSSTTLTLETNRTERTNFTNGSKPTDHEWPTPLESYSQ